MIMVSYLQSLPLEWILGLLTIFLISQIAGRKSQEELERNPIALSENVDRLHRLLSIASIVNFFCSYTLFLLLFYSFSSSKSQSSDFNSIFELSFGLNIIFYLYNLLPNFQDMLERILDKAKDQEKEIEDLGVKRQPMISECTCTTIIPAM